MADFLARIASGVTRKVWVDPPASLPSRLNPITGVQHTYDACSPYALLTIKCQPWYDGLGPTPFEGLADSFFGGRLFVPYFVEAPALFPSFVATPGYSSIVQVQPVTKGHYLLGIYRPGGGAQLLRFTCE